VEELGKHIKITKTCSSDKLTDCFTSTITTTGDPVETSKLKASKNLYSTEDYGTETIGVQFADGVSALIAYNPNATQDPLSNQVVRLTGSKDSVGLSTDAISILYDVSGGKTPNQMDTGKDIRGINIAIKTGAGFKVLAPGSFPPVDCRTTSASYDTYCGRSPSGYNDDYWAGANKACADEGMHFPTIEELLDLYARKGEEGIPTSGYYWSSSENGNFDAYEISFDHGGVNDTSYKLGSNHYVLCVGN